MGTKEVDTALRLQWERDAAVFSRVWYLTEGERQKLDTHVALRCSLLEFGHKMFEDEEDFLKDKIAIGVVTYEVHYLNTSATKLMEAFVHQSAGGPPYQLVLSLRVVNSRSFAVCLVQPRWESLTEEKFLSYREAWQS